MSTVDFRASTRSVPVANVIDQTPISSPASIPLGVCANTPPTTTFFGTVPDADPDSRALTTASAAPTLIEPTSSCAAVEDSLRARERRATDGRRAAGSPALSAAYPPRGESAAEVRAALRTYLAHHGVDPCVTWQVVLAADEAFVNAVTHARDDQDVGVSARVSRRRIVVEVRDLGHGFVPRRSRRRPVPGVGRTHGRGVFLMRSMMDEVILTPRRDGTTVRMVRRLGR
jgi:anti-sigma regulatory factor (Ser/Thr protein kinase)